MAQLVFVHGVATRPGQDYDAAVANRNLLIERVLFEGTPVTIHSPMWGDRVPELDPKVFETEKEVKTFSLGGSSTGMGGGLANNAGPSAVTTAAVVNQSPLAGIDALFATLVEEADRKGEVLGAQEVEAFLKATKLAEQERPALPAFADDGALLAHLKPTAAQSYGLASKLGDAVQKLTDRLRNRASTVAFDAVRDRLSPAIAFFLGDIFAYLREGDARSEIQRRIRVALTAAQAHGEPVIVIGHSLGGVILCDMLSRPDEAGLPDDLSISTLITVGSQPGLFQGIGALGMPVGSKRPRPPSVKRWFNVFDPIDPLAFRADPYFTDVEDLQFDSVSGLASAHTTYFKRPQFYARARQRLNLGAS